eukprot:Gregarina_sp_Poly_1__220@NODE_1051_length_5230_cov_265_105559_g731_i0_p1_GENE_NODE_1051_length_5230_cov_265_105559_g731_i0NODE_1051_length_5230_cov_265_105559_g731_i0_p1_ORF_typecomplete_len456_score52_25SET/PF00856_28/3e15SET/PF00856_28/2_6e03_NODE_1051_length_5230_cov_265_105559_g731_i08342201
MWSVENQEKFQTLAALRTHRKVGRSLVANRLIQLGDVVLEEKPIIKYKLKPDCRSSDNPKLSKYLWNALQTIVREETAHLSDSFHPRFQKETEVFVPGIPAALIAILRPSTRLLLPQIFAFFYSPINDANLEKHPTVILIRKIVQRVKTELAEEFQQVEASEAEKFIGIIYGNAHGISFSVDPERVTHSKKRKRRRMYQAKHPEDGRFSVTEWPSQRSSLPSVPHICLFPWGSRMCHSCQPNLFVYYSNTKDSLLFIACRPIAAGEVLSFSYLPDSPNDCQPGRLLCGAASDRQIHLWLFKFFQCQCSRCLRDLPCEWGHVVALCELPENDPASISHKITMLRAFSSPNGLQNLCLQEALLWLMQQKQFFTRSSREHEKEQHDQLLSYCSAVQTVLWKSGFQTSALIRLGRLTECLKKFAPKFCQSLSQSMHSYVSLFTKELPELREAFSTFAHV